MISNLEMLAFLPCFFMVGIGRPFTWKSEGCDFGAYHPANISFGKLHIDLIYVQY